MKFIREVISRFKNVFSKKELTLWEQAEEKWKKVLDASVKNGIIKREGNMEYSYDEFNTNVMQWAYHPDREAGDTKVFYKRGNFVLVKATKDGFVELKSGKYEEVSQKYERGYGRKDNSFYEHSDKVRSGQNGHVRNMQYDRLRGNDDRDVRQVGGKGLQNDTSRGDEYLRRSDRREPVKETVPEGAKPKLKDVDAEYVKAVENGDTETAQKMIDEAAKANV